MSGEVNPDKLDLDRSLFLYWKAYFELEMSELHTKDEYYYASIIQSIYASSGVKDIPSVNDLLIKFRTVTQAQLDEEQKKMDLAIFDLLTPFDKNKNTKGK
jgi:hypothetical protein